MAFMRAPWRRCIIAGVSSRTWAFVLSLLLLLAGAGVVYGLPRLLASDNVGPPAPIEVTVPEAPREVRRSPRERRQDSAPRPAGPEAPSRSGPAPSPGRTQRPAQPRQAPPTADGDRNDGDGRGGDPDVGAERD